MEATVTSGGGGGGGGGGPSPVVACTNCKSDKNRISKTQARAGGKCVACVGAMVREKEAAQKRTSGTSGARGGTGAKRAKRAPSDPDGCALCGGDVSPSAHLVMGCAKVRGS
jgi:hypothetical protein